MKTFLILIVLLPIYVLGSEISSVNESQYDAAVKAYKANNFKSSYKILSKLYIYKLSDPKTNYYLGRSAFETGHYEVALAAFERVEMLDPSNLSNTLQMARTYFMLKMYKDSELAFQEVLDNPNIPKNVRTNIELYLSKVTKVQQKSFTYATINLDWVYDSNVNYGSIGGEYKTDSSTLPSPEITDRALQIYADIVNIYDIGSANGFAIKNRAKVFLKDYKKMNKYDVQYLAYTPSLLYKETKYLAEIVVGFELLTLNKKEYLRTYTLNPRYEYSHSNTLRSISYLKYQAKDFTQKAHVNLDADHFEIAYALQKILSPRSYVQSTITGIGERKLRGTRIDVDYDEIRVNLIYAKQFSAIYGSEFYAEYRRRSYKDEAKNNYSNKRVDNAGTISATINARITKNLRLHLKGTYNRVESNQDRFTYQKYTVTAGLNKTF